MEATMSQENVEVLPESSVVDELLKTIKVKEVPQGTKIPVAFVTRYVDGRNTEVRTIHGMTPRGWAREAEMFEGAKITELLKSREWRIVYPNGEVEYSRDYVG